MTYIKKRGYNMTVSWELMFYNASLRDKRYLRIEKSRTPIPIPQSEWDHYGQAKAAGEVLESYSNFHLYNDWDILPPEQKYDIEYAETHDEWIERCMKMWNS